MRGIETQKTRLRQRVFAEIANLAYNGDGPEALDELPFKILPGEIASYRDSIFLERAIVGERLRSAMGMSIRPLNQHSPISKGVDASMIEEKYYEPPLIDIIKFACHKCPTRARKMRCKIMLNRQQTLETGSNRKLLFCRLLFSMSRMIISNDGKSSFHKIWHQISNRITFFATAHFMHHNHNLGKGFRTIDHTWYDMTGRFIKLNHFRHLFFLSGKYTLQLLTSF